MTAELMREMCERHGLRVIEQIESWDDGRVWIWPGLPKGEGPDIVTRFARA